MNLLYGTYLSFLVVETMQLNRKPLSVREIALLIHIYDGAREQRNFNDRVRRSVKGLLQQNMIRPVQKTTDGNIIVTKYSLHEQSVRADEVRNEKSQPA